MTIITVIIAVIAIVIITINLLYITVKIRFKNTDFNLDFIFIGFIFIIQK